MWVVARDEIVVAHPDDTTPFGFERGKAGAEPRASASTAGASVPPSSPHTGRDGG
jgi:hypothetical protein